MASKKSLFYILIFFFWTIFLPQNLVLAAGNTYYVATNGNDTNPGTQSSPWKTIQKAANTMLAGDSVTVVTGNYGERVQVTKSGSAGSPITYQTSGTAIMKGFTVNANYITIKGFEITNTIDNQTDGIGIFAKGSNNLIENNYIYSCTWGGIQIYAEFANPTATSNCIVRNNRLYHNSQNGITILGRNHLVEGNEIWDSIQYHPKMANPPAWVDADGMRYFGAGHTIRKNYIHDIKYGPPGLNPTLGDYIDDAHIDCFQTWGDNQYHETPRDIIIEQNLCLNAQVQALYEGGQGLMIQKNNENPSIKPTNLIIRNNIIAAYKNINIDGGDSLKIINNTFISNPSLNTAYNPVGVSLGNCPNTIIKNNIFYDLPGHIIYTDAASLPTLQAGKNLAFRNDGKSLWTTNTYPHTNDLWAVDPKMVNPAGADYHLTASSPAINTGENVSSLVNNDYDGNLRPQGVGFDIGAFEYTGVAQPSSTPSPTPTPIPGDVNGDGHVNMADYSLFVSKYGTNDSSCDFNHNGLVDMADYTILVANYGKY